MKLIIDIDCEHEVLCQDCEHLNNLDRTCKLFRQFVFGVSNTAREPERCIECIRAEVKE
jgi:hypothetical protein